MAPRLELQVLLKGLLGSDNVYFQPPPDFKIAYPCIIYERDRVQMLYSDNLPYNHQKRYVVTYIDRNPDSDIPDKIAMLPKCSFERFYTAENLNHDVYNLFF